MHTQHTFGPTVSPAQHLEWLKAECRAGTPTLTRLRRLGRLVAAGRPVRVTGHPEQAANFRRAILGYATKVFGLVPADTLTLDALLLRVQHGPTTALLVRDGVPETRYALRLEQGTLHVTPPGGVTREVDLATFTTLFRGRVWTLDLPVVHASPRPQAA